MTVILCILCHVTACKFHTILPKRAWITIVWRLSQLQLCLTLERLVTSIQKHPWLPLTQHLVSTNRLFQSGSTWETKAQAIKTTASQVWRVSWTSQKKFWYTPGSHLVFENPAALWTDDWNSHTAINHGDRHENHSSRLEWHQNQRPVCYLNVLMRSK